MELCVVPRSSTNKFIMEEQGIKLKITAAPVDGVANKKIIEILSKTFSCPKTSIELYSGTKSKYKRFIFHQLSEERGQEILAQLLSKE
ncbi:MAG: DUF167 domain-containing protein [Brevinema sp.]